jgi:hypothetical protein
MIDKISSWKTMNQLALHLYVCERQVSVSEQFQAEKRN